MKTATEKTVILITASISVFFEALDIAIINLAMPLIQQQFDLTQASVQWLQTLYVLVYGGFLILGGKLSDVYGRKEIFLAGSVLFMITSLGAALSPSFAWLVVFRAVQGLAAAFVMPSAMAIVTNTFTEAHERSKAVGIFSSFAALGSGSGLSVGGLLASSFGWQSVFFINVPVIAATLVLAARFIPKTLRNEQKPAPDILAGMFITTGIIGLSYLVHSFTTLLSRPWLLLALVIFIAAAFLLFAVRNRRPEPLINFTLLRGAQTVIGNMTMVLLGAFFTGYLFVISLVLQNNMAFSAARAGLLLFPFSVMSALVGKFMIPLLSRRLSMLQVAIVGMASMMLGALMLILAFELQFELALVLASVACVTGIGMAVSFTGLTVITLEKLPEEQHGLGASFSMTGYFFGGGLGLAVLSGFMSYETGHQGVQIHPLEVLSVYAVLAVLILLLLKVLDSRARIRHPAAR